MKVQLALIASASLFLSCATPAANSSTATPIETDHHQAEGHKKHKAHKKHDGPGHAAGHHHAFDDAEKWAKRFEHADRDAWQKPQLVLASLKLSPAMRIADIGSATGYFPVRLAKAVPDGRVWGVDVEPDMVRYLNERARKEGISNLFSVMGHPNDALIPEPVDRVLVVNTYHHISNRTAYFRKLKSRLRPGAQIAIVDFVKGELPFGPPDEMKLAPAQVEAELQAAGYVLENSIEGLPHQYMLIFGLPR